MHSLLKVAPTVCDRSTVLTGVGRGGRGTPGCGDAPTSYPGLPSCVWLQGSVCMMLGEQPRSLGPM